MDLTTNYLGLRLNNPLMAAAAAPLSRDLDMVRSLEDAGIAGVVLYSLFQEQIEHEVAAQRSFEELGKDSFAEAQSFGPQVSCFPCGPDEYVGHLGRVKEAVDIPVIASLNGSTTGGWIEYATALEQAGANALELNIYHIPTDPAVTAAAIEDRYVEILSSVKDVVSIPVAVKLGPFFSSLPNFAKRLDDSGVDGLVLFNRFYQPDINLDELQVTPDLVLSAQHELRLPLRWIAILDPLIDASLAATTGIYTSADVIKLLMVGADATMLCAVLLRRGPGAVSEMLSGITSWLEEHEYGSVRQLQGSMNHRTCENPGAFERANYIEALNSYA